MSKVQSLILVLGCGLFQLSFYQLSKNAEEAQLIQILGQNARGKVPGDFERGLTVGAQMKRASVINTVQLTD